MLDIKPIHNLSLEPQEIEIIETSLALKYFVLFADINEQTSICLSENHLGESLNLISKYSLDYPTVFLDNDSFERLYNKFLEKKTDSELSTLSQTEGMEEVAEEESNLSLTEFLRNKADLLNSEESAPIIKFVNSLFYQAVKKKASDIHVEVHEQKGEVRFRIDGILIKYADLDIKVMNFVISRIKVISNLDISEKRTTQDGRTQIKIAGKVLDVRVSVLPTYYGERVVMRILMESQDIPHMRDLGFSNALVEKFETLLDHSHGIILVTGPTGSGKSTTLHAFLQRIASPEKNVITVEDPVEYKADNISQVQANPKVGLSFASGLRSILRQDPDVIMIGEIRDDETATIAIQAALTGHLVFSTLHTNNATASITRLVDMGIEKFLISSSILGVLAQRLVRLLCPKCKEQDIGANIHGLDLKGAQIFKPIGCPYCNHTGYFGRRAIGELFIMDDEIKIALKGDTDDHSIRSKAIKNGMETLFDELLDLVRSGQTSLEEAIRIGINEK